MSENTMEPFKVGFKCVIGVIFQRQLMVTMHKDDLAAKILPMNHSAARIAIFVNTSSN